MEQHLEVTSADIARLAGVRPTAVSNWRRRHDDFPKPVGGTDRSPRFDLGEVEEWLRRQGRRPAIPPAELLWQAFESTREVLAPAEALALVGLLLLHLRGHPDAPAPADAAGFAAALAQARETFADLLAAASCAASSSAGFSSAGSSSAGAVPAGQNAAGSGDGAGAGAAAGGVAAMLRQVAGPSAVDDPRVETLLGAAVRAATEEPAAGEAAAGEAAGGEAAGGEQPADPFAATFESLCARYFETGTQTGAIATAPELAELMVDLAAAGEPPRPDGPVSFEDPACGGGAVLLAAAARGFRRLSGLDVNASLALVTALRLIFRFFPAGSPRPAAGRPAPSDLPRVGFTVTAGDALRDPPRAAPVHTVVVDSPFAVRNWGHEELVHDPRWAYGVPPRTEYELAWVQHALSRVVPGGWVAILMPPAAAFRPSGRRIRAELIRRGALRAVFSLPAGLAAHYALALQIWLLRRPPETRPGQSGHSGRPDRPGHELPDGILMVDAGGVASGDPAADAAAATADGARAAGEGAWASADGARMPTPADDPAAAGTARDAKDVAAVWARVRALVTEVWAGYLADPQGFAERAGVARVVPVTDLLDETVDVTPRRHLPPPPPPGVTASELRSARRQLAALLDAVGEVLPPDPGRLPDLAGARVPMASLDELAKAGSLHIRRSSPSASARAGQLAQSAPSPQGPAVPAARGAGRRRQPDGADGLVEARIVTAYDIARGEPPSQVGQVEADPVRNPPIRAGDVLVPAVARRLVARVAAGEDVGAYPAASVHVVRTDPEILDPWFLAGLLSSTEGNRQAERLGSSLGGQMRVELRRVRVPLPSIEVQRAYGAVFRQIAEFSARLQQARDVGLDLARATTDALGLRLRPPVAEDGDRAASWPGPGDGRDSSAARRGTGPDSPARPRR